MSEETLYERLGGRESIAAVVDEFYDRVMADDRVNYYFEDVDMTRQRAHQAQFISSVTGGPVEYTGEDMATVHEGMGITEEEFNAIATHLDDPSKRLMFPSTSARRYSRRLRATRTRSSARNQRDPPKAVFALTRQIALLRATPVTHSGRLASSYHPWAI